MDIRLISKQYIDMDELSKTWESNNCLINPLYKEYNESLIQNNLDIVEYIKRVKEIYATKETQEEKGKVLKR